VFVPGGIAFREPSDSPLHKIRTILRRVGAYRMSTALVRNRNANTVPLPLWTGRRAKSFLPYRIDCQRQSKSNLKSAILRRMSDSDECLTSGSSRSDLRSHLLRHSGCRGCGLRIDWKQCRAQRQSCAR
jgi:hypothetical protein